MATQPITAWLAKIGLERYAAAFADNDIDVSVLRHLTDADLEKIGVSLGNRRKILAAIGELSNTPAAPAPPATPRIESRIATPAVEAVAETINGSADRSPTGCFHHRPDPHYRPNSQLEVAVGAVEKARRGGDRRATVLRAASAARRVRFDTEGTGTWAGSAGPEKMGRDVLGPEDPVLIFSGTRLFSEATRILVDAMEAKAVKRLICVTGLGAGDSRGHGGLLYDAVLWLILGRVYADRMYRSGSYAGAVWTGPSFARPS
jgi:SAM domain (Sterile alpha motif)